MPTAHESPRCSTSLQALGMISLCNFSRPHGCEAIPSRPFPWWPRRLGVSLCAYFYATIYSLWQNVHSNPLLFLKLGCLFSYIYWVLRILYIFEYTSYQTHSFQIFSSSSWYVFLYLNRAFLKNRSFKFGWSLVCQFVLLSIILLILNLQNLCQTQKSQRSPPVFPSRSFIVTGVSFKSAVHFELIFVFGAGYS